MANGLEMWEPLACNSLHYQSMVSLAKSINCAVLSFSNL